jgi:GR25 family glycosyltransferase involved in LPS biosynthesis
MLYCPDIPAFCISLRDSPRRPAFARSATAHSVAFEFVDAISPTDLYRGAVIKDCRVDVTDLRWTQHQQTDPRRQEAPLLFTEICCAYSHIMCWQIAKSRNMDYVCIFEDDAIICRTLKGIKLRNFVDIFHLGDRIPHNWRGEITGDGCGAEGYILSRTGILKCLEIFRILYMPIDLQIMAHELNHVRKSPGIFDYRRDIDRKFYLNGRVATNPYCRHPHQNQSQMYSSDLHRIVAERDQLRLQVAALHRSTSWRVTAPARAIRAAFGWTARGAAHL